MHSKGSPPPFMDPQRSSCQAAALQFKSIRSGRRGLLQAADKSGGQSVRQLQLFSPAGSGQDGGGWEDPLPSFWQSDGIPWVKLESSGRAPDDERVTAASDS